MSRQVYDDFEKKSKQSMNDKLISVREIFDEYNLISSLHSYMSVYDSQYKNLLPPLILLSKEKQKEIMSKLEKLKFFINKDIAA